MLLKKLTVKLKLLVTTEESTSHPMKSLKPPLISTDWLVTSIYSKPTLPTRSS